MNDNSFGSPPKREREGDEDEKEESSESPEKKSKNLIGSNNFSSKVLSPDDIKRIQDELSSNFDPLNRDTREIILRQLTVPAALKLRLSLGYFKYEFRYQIKIIADELDGGDIWRYWYIRDFPDVVNDLYSGREVQDEDGGTLVLDASVFLKFPTLLNLPEWAGQSVRGWKRVYLWTRLFERTLEKLAVKLLDDMHENLQATITGLPENTIRNFKTPSYNEFQIIKTNGDVTNYDSFESFRDSFIWFCHQGNSHGYRIKENVPWLRTSRMTFLCQLIWDYQVAGTEFIARVFPGTELQVQLMGYGNKQLFQASNPDKIEEAANFYYVYYMHQRMITDRIYLKNYHDKKYLSYSSGNLLKSQALFPWVSEQSAEHFYAIELGDRSGSPSRKKGRIEAIEGAFEVDKEFIAPYNKLAADLYNKGSSLEDGESYGVQIHGAVGNPQPRWDDIMGFWEHFRVAKPSVPAWDSIGDHPPIVKIYQFLSYLYTGYLGEDMLFFEVMDATSELFKIGMMHQMSDFPLISVDGKTRIFLGKRCQLCNSLFLQEMETTKHCSECLETK